MKAAGVKTPNIRACAAGVLSQLLRQQGSLASLLPEAARDLPPEQQALLRELCFGTARWFFALDAVLLTLLDKPLKSKDADVRCLLLLGLYQLAFMRLPHYAAINETVNACTALRKVWAKRLANAIMRQFQRQLEIDQNPFAELPPAARAGFPDWLYTSLQQAWPEQLTTVLQSSNAHPPMTLRVNRRQGDRAQYLTALQHSGLEAHAGRLTDTALYLQTPVAVQVLPDFDNGRVSVQDEASQLIPVLLDLAPAQRVLDACAAPGGKTSHMLETQPDLAGIVALDVNERRLQRVFENLQRLQLPPDKVTIAAADASDLNAWWNGEYFDRILLDAPCSATGILRRQPDVKVLRQPSDIARLQTLQATLLDALWQTLKPGGILLYSTCSILPAENSEQIAQFLNRTADAQEIPVAAANGGVFAASTSHGLQLLPGEDGPDGFYFAKLRKRAADTQ